MFAIIESGSKQYRVAIGDVVKVDMSYDYHYERRKTEIKIPALAVIDGDKTCMCKLQNGDVACCCVRAMIIDGNWGEKITIFKMKRRKGYRRKRGYRSFFGVLRIIGIGDCVDECALIDGKVSVLKEDDDIIEISNNISNNSEDVDGDEIVRIVKNNKDNDEEN